MMMTLGQVYVVSIVQTRRVEELIQHRRQRCNPSTILRPETRIELQGHADKGYDLATPVLVLRLTHDLHGEVPSHLKRYSSAAFGEESRSPF